MVREVPTSRSQVETPDSSLADQPVALDPEIREITLALKAVKTPSVRAALIRFVQALVDCEEANESR